MKEYYIDQSTEEKTYGIYDYLSLGKEVKTLGGVSKDKFLFQIGVGDHYVSHQEIDKIIGEKIFYISTYRDIYEEEVTIYIQYIRYEDEEEITEFGYECALGILEECLKYKKETNENIKIAISDKFFIDNEERCTGDIESIISSIKETIEHIRGKKK